LGATPDDVDVIFERGYVVFINAGENVVTGNDVEDIAFTEPVGELLCLNCGCGVLD
jgi:hypothetical protein